MSIIARRRRMRRMRSQFGSSIRAENGVCCGCMDIFSWHRYKFAIVKTLMGERWSWRLRNFHQKPRPPRVFEKCRKKTKLWFSHMLRIQKGSNRPKSGLLKSAQNRVCCGWRVIFSWDRYLFFGVKTLMGNGGFEDRAYFTKFSSPPWFRKFTHRPKLLDFGEKWWKKGSSNWMTFEYVVVV